MRVNWHGYRYGFGEKINKAKDKKHLVNYTFKILNLLGWCFAVDNVLPTIPSSGDDSSDL
jgi:hypothetical protein